MALASQACVSAVGHGRALSSHEKPEMLNPQRLIVLPFTAADEGGVYRAANDFAARVADEATQAGEQGQADKDAVLLDLAGSLTRVASRHPKAWRSFSTTLTGHAPEEPVRQRPPAPCSLWSPVAVVADQPVCFIFPGQGSQWPQMGQRLRDAFPVFAASLRASDEVLAELQHRHHREDRGGGGGGGRTTAPWSLAHELAAPEASTRLARGAAANAVYDVIMPAITALQIALVDLLADWGVRPAAVAGHSLGEVAAAYCSGALSRRAALRVVYHRGLCAARLAESPRRGDMMITSASEERLQSCHLPSLTSGQAWIGGTMPTEGPDHHATIVSGDVAALDELMRRLEQEGVKCRRLGQRLAWHTPRFGPLKDEFMRSLGGCDTTDGLLPGPLGPGTTTTGQEGRGCRQFSSLTGGLVAASTLRTPAYWGDSLVSAVNFKDSFASMVQHVGEGLKSEKHVFLEIGPHPVFRRIILSAFETAKTDERVHQAAHADMAVARNNVHQERKTRQMSISYNCMLQDDCDDVQCALEAVGRLWCHGCRVDLDRMNFPPGT